MEPRAGQSHSLRADLWSDNDGNSTDTYRQNAFTHKTSPFPSHIHKPNLNSDDAPFLLTSLYISYCFHILTANTAVSTVNTNTYYYKSILFFSYTYMHTSNTVKINHIILCFLKYLSVKKTFHFCSLCVLDFSLFLLSSEKFKAMLFLFVAKSVLLTYLYFVSKDLKYVL